MEKLEIILRNENNAPQEIIEEKAFASEKVLRFIEERTKVKESNFH